MTAHVTQRRHTWADPRNTRPRGPVPGAAHASLLAGLGGNATRSVVTTAGEARIVLVSHRRLRGNASANASVAVLRRVAVAGFPGAAVSDQTAGPAELAAVVPPPRSPRGTVGR
ncbi:MAG: hypothetical protein M3083_06260 [Actinomycetota bacterium]|nr:hypothetical protein [Actinomycetota bacterium]MDQ6947891.1 hypothetical protein [Actinomycetota bacterium]